MTDGTMQRIVLARRPAGEPSPEDFRLEEVAAPTPGAGEVLVRGLWLSLDPYMRGRMNDVKSYVPPTALGETMPGGVVGEVLESNDPGFAPGDIVEGRTGWQELAAAPARELRLVPDLGVAESTALGVLGMPGMTAWFGLFEVGQAKAGETVVVSAASGAVGATVGQLAKLKGCRAVGIAGGPEKCAWVTDELGLDACIDYRGEDLGARLGETCPDGIDVYFDNVGGRTLDTVLRHLRFRARIAICGMISEYNLEKPDLVPRPTRALLVNRARMEGFIVFDFARRYGEALEVMGPWVRDGKLKYREDVTDGLENAPAAFIRLLSGGNFGKALVKLADRG